MPLYEYAYDDNGERFEEYQSITAEALVERNGRACHRVPQLPRMHTAYGEGNNCEPIKMLSIALDNEADIAEFRRRNPGTEVSSDRRSPDFGVPVVRSRSEKLKVLANEGFMEKN
jgi:hypothetical protein